jgi:hypothetical protein
MKREYTEINKCKGCYFEDMCSYDIESLDSTLTELEQHLEMCGGCACGDGFECNKGRCWGCSNYDTEVE